jgi:hypothetical protein
VPSFLAPLFLAGAAAAAIPIILHFLKREPEARVRFAAVRLLKQGPVEQTEKRLLRDLLLLALRVAALILLSLAFARPFFASAQAPSSAITVVALDTSLSLSAPGRFERAKQLAKDAIGRAPAGERIGVITIADQAQIVSPASGDRRLALAAIDAARIDFGSTRYRAALRAAGNLLEGHGGTIVAVTDLQASGWDVGDQVALPENARLDLMDVGALPSNLAITAVRIERDRLVATIRNASPVARDVRADLTLRRGAASGGRLSSERGGVAAISLGANQAGDVTWPRPQNADAAIVQVTDKDGVDGDNVRYIVLDRGNRSAVLVVTPQGDLAREAFYVQQALAAGGGDDRAYQADGVEAAQLSSWSADRLSRYAAVVLTSTEGLESRGRDLIRGYVSAGGGLLLAAAPGVDEAVVADVLADVSVASPVDSSGRTTVRTLAPIDGRHPLFGVFGPEGASLTLVNFRRIAAIGGEGCQPLARFTTGEVAMLDCGRGQGRALVLASDLDNRWNDFPLKATFVPFLHEAVRYLAGTRPRQSEYIVGEQPAGIGRTPGLSVLPASATAPARWVAVNVDARESAPARLSAPEFQSAVARLKEAPSPTGPVPVEARRQEDLQHLWQYVLAAVIVALVAESFVAARTI